MMVEGEQLMKDCRFALHGHWERCAAKFNHCSFCHEDIDSLLTHRCDLMAALGIPFHDHKSQGFTVRRRTI